MIRLDVYTKAILTVIAVLMAILLIRGGSDWGMSQAQAQTTRKTQVAVNLIKEIPVADFKEVILLGDQKTFLIRVDKGIGVYQVQEF